MSDIAKQQCDDIHRRFQAGQTIFMRSEVLVLLGETRAERDLLFMQNARDALEITQLRQRLQEQAGHGARLEAALMGEGKITDE